MDDSDDSGFCEEESVRCSDCQNFTVSLGAPGERGYCGQATSWNGAIIQFLNDSHPCTSFEAKDSVKVMADRDEDISCKVGEAVQAFDIGEVEI